MSRLRTGHTPDGWEDEGPGSARVTGHGGRMLAGEYVTSTVRPVNPDPRHHGQGHDLVTRELRPPPKPECGHPMRLTGEPCGRRIGHADDHRSRVVLDRRAALRRRPTRYNVTAGTSSHPIDSPTTPHPLLVPEGAASLRLQGRD